MAEKQVDRPPSSELLHGLGEISGLADVDTAWTMSELGRVLDIVPELMALTEMDRQACVATIFLAVYETPGDPVQLLRARAAPFLGQQPPPDADSTRRIARALLAVANTMAWPTR